ncbi:hypothetical protein EVAR_59039_1 [Eumeta japonica]|uniref:Uncharacterized protein n=1 Tax=Eumeta variegata TaxID=151549 RepID=A0A4C1Z724_EUMVA|nr:hypothetical protein EVAR_59039_1 [Eumeta japonica]
MVEVPVRARARAQPLRLGRSPFIFMGLLALRPAPPRPALVHARGKTSNPSELYSRHTRHYRVITHRLT